MEGVASNLLNKQAIRSGPVAWGFTDKNPEQCQNVPRTWANFVL